MKMKRIINFLNPRKNYKYYFLFGSFIAVATFGYGFKAAVITLIAVIVFGVVTGVLFVMYQNFRNRR